MLTHSETKDVRNQKPDPVSQVQQDLGLVDPGSIALDEKPDPAIETMADDFLKKLLAINPEDPAQLEVRSRNIAAVENLGAETQRQVSVRSAMLKEPIRKLMAKGDDGGQVANALVDLNEQVEELDPAKFDFEPGWFARTLGFIPGVGRPLKRYFIRFESAQTVLDAIFNSLNQGADMLKRDNLTLAEDQKHMRILTDKLKKSIQLGMLLDAKLSHALEREIAPEDSRQRFIQDELLFPIRQRIMDLQQQLAVAQQAILSIELIMRNNKELIRGVSRATHVTANALNVAVVVAMALANQRIVLNKISALNTTTNKLIADTAASLKAQGTAIHKDAASSKLDINTLKQAFADIQAAMDDISKYRREALPQMATAVLEMERLTHEAETAIKKMEKGNQATPITSLDVDYLEID
ncbi:MAG: toxic anion resistance protein [Pseudomonadota bacterium]